MGCLYEKEFITYINRKDKGLVVEKRSSIYCREDFSRRDVERSIFANPFKRFEDMRFMKRSREVELVEFNRNVFKRLTEEDKDWIREHCMRKLEEYFGRGKWKLNNANINNKRLKLFFVLNYAKILLSEWVKEIRRFKQYNTWYYITF